MNRNPHSLKRQDKPAFVSIHDQKHRAQYGYGAMSTPKKKSASFGETEPSAYPDGKSG